MVLFRVNWQLKRIPWERNVEFAHIGVNAVRSVKIVAWEGMSSGWAGF